MKVSFLYGTETGNAEMLCDDLVAHFEEDHDVSADNLDEISPADLSPDQFYVFVCSTYGEGDLPQSAISFVDALKAEKTDLSGIRCAVFGLGDSSYHATYNQGSNVLMTALVEAGIEVVGERGLHDASGLDALEDVGVPWAEARISDAAEHFT